MSQMKVQLQEQLIFPDKGCDDPCSVFWPYRERDRLSLSEHKFLLEVCFVFFNINLLFFNSVTASAS